MNAQPQQDILTLTHGASTLRIAPWAGGRLLSWQLDGQPVIVWPENANWAQPARVRGGNPLLFPFLGRHFVDGKIGRWRDANGVVRDLPMHGFARDLPFAAQPDADGHGLRMTLVDTEATRVGYPFAFRFEAAYRLIDEHTLEVTLSATNTGTEPMPWYAGHHFYFALPHAQRAQTTLELPPSERRYQLPDGSISTPEPGAPEYRLDDASIIDRFHVLRSTSPAPVRLHAPGLGREITIDLNCADSLPWYAVTTWTEAPDSDFYCVEPWLGLPDAIHNGLGLRWLAPGNTETATLRIGVKTLAA
ncbi:aldose epimerase family protein [Paraburkholderia acidisoli]|uniref:Aldose epimerase n=1 Tax=Paraburkholderia acidisoli TaxID=2571748 RepID=A0A7Z2GGM7_9BURK|nr:aldose epimerase [Paraburkholderia acidisoli]QGZ61075.1 aldose epimerase [Paraburkholderia acidisoli]